METNQQLAELQEKIESLGTAIFLNYSESVLRLPSSVIAAARVDEYGFIWFYASKWNDTIQVNDQAFPLRLSFFRKGVDFFVQLDGLGWVVTDPETIGWYHEVFQMPAPADKTQVLVKVKMQQVQLSESKKEISHGWRSIMTNYLSWPMNMLWHKKPGYYA